MDVADMVSAKLWVARPLLGPRPLRDRFRALMRDRRGSTIAMMTAGLIPGIAALGSAIDIGRVYMVKSQLQAGVDAAALAGARAFAVTDDSARSRGSQASNYFYGNFPSGYMGTTGLVLTPDFKVVNNVNTTTVTATAQLPFSFMKAFGFQQQQVTAVAKAELQPRPLEVEVVLDNTGSMRSALSGGKTRIQALKDASNSFVDILFQGSDQRNDLAMGFVMYDITANVGALLTGWNANSVVVEPGLNDSTSQSYLGKWPNNTLGWKGCVMADSTIVDVSSDRTVSEPGAWDLTRTLPGEGADPPIEPYYIPPVWVPKLKEPNTTSSSDYSAWVAARADPNSDYYKVSGGEPSNNMFRLDQPYGIDQANLLANTAVYRGFFYDYYIGLNNGAANNGDDVIVSNDNAGSYYNPISGNRSTTNWKIRYDRIPHVNDTTYWKSPTVYTINPQGGQVDNFSSNQTANPSPNWQCPEAATAPVYNRPKSFYTNIIAQQNAAIYPANGTLHHSGLLWGYRLLVRDDAFKRTNPTNSTPRRAIVFMTDGINEVTEDQNGYLDRTFTWYGRWVNGSGPGTSQANRIASSQANTQTQSVRRFAKTCANIQREANPPLVYIISLVANDSTTNTMFNQCAPGRVYQTSSTDELKSAFQDVATQLVDLHLVQ